jgi:transcriptional regulator with XRE-family HTH domain
MITKKKSPAMKFLEKASGGPLTFGNMIHSIRLCDEISQSKLAEMTHISRSYLCDIENGRRFVSVEKAAEFAKVLGYSEAHFVSVLIEDQLKHAGMPFVVELKKAA